MGYNPFLKRGEFMKKERKITIALLVIYLLILSWIILFKLQFSFSTLDHIRQINLIPFSDSVIANGRIDFDEIINNVIVFIPVGVYFSLLFRNKSFLKVIGSVLSISLAYETIQFIFAIGASDITALICNTLGGLIGIALVYVLSLVLKDKTNKILNRIALVCTILVVAFLFLLLSVNNMF